MKSIKRTIFLTVICAVLRGAIVFGQGTSGVISGTVLDPQGSALFGATVKIRNLETGVTRELKSDSSGFYRVTGLAPGLYEAQASAQGFTSETRGNLALTVADAIVVNFNLKVGEARENVTVTVQTASVETTGPTLSGLVDEKKIRDLPLDGRDVTQLIFLQPGVVESRGSAQSSNTGRGARFSVGGARPSQNLFQLDGTTLNDALNNTPGSAQGLLIGVETIKEFRVLTNAYSAEYNRAAGGVFIAVTKSGTNDLHGSLFEFLRNDNLDARTFFDRCSGANPNCDGGGKPEFQRNQFGGSLGGPIVRNKTFFFGSYEGLREFKGISTVAAVPDDNALRGVLPSGTVTIDPRAMPLIALFPRANGALILDEDGNPTGAAEFVGVTPRISDGDFFSVRVDHQFSASDSLFVRYLFDDSEQTLVRFFPQYPNLSLNRKQVATIEERKFIGANVVNEARFSFNRSTPSELVPDPGIDISLVAGQPLGEVNVTGLHPIGTDRTNPKLFFQNNFQIADNLYINLGRNNIKTGFSFDRFQFNGRSESRTRGRLRFRSISDFLRFRVRDLEGSTFDSDFVRGYRQSLFGFYFQDDFKVTPRLTLNLGARYDYVTSPDEVNGKIANLRNITDTAVTVGGELFRTTRKGIAPRFGFAYDVFGDGRTAIRGGVGVFHEIPLFNAYRSVAFGSLPFINTSSLSASQVQSLPVSSSAFANPGGALLTESITFNLQPTYVIQYNLNVQQEAFGAIMTFAYVGSRSVNLLGQGDINTAIPQILPDGRSFFADDTRRNPTFDAIRSQIQGFSSNYNGLNVSANRRFSKGLQFQLSYTFGKSLDNRSGNSGRQEYTNGQARTFDPYDRGLDYGRSDFDVRHNFTANFTYDLPFGKGLKGLAGAAISGWQINSIVKLASGIPFTPLVAGDPDGDGTDENTARADLIGDPNAGPRTVEQWFNLAAFAEPREGFRGTAGRNIVNGPNFKTVDLSLNKRFALSERFNLQFRIETFNLFNHVNFDLPSNSDDGATLFIPGAGRINGIVGTAREIQLGLKLVF